jgi:hypothetical protein
VGLKTSHTVLLDDTGRNLTETYRIPDHLDYTECVSTHFDLTNDSVQAVITSAGVSEPPIETAQQNLDGSLELYGMDIESQSPADITVPTEQKRHRNEVSSSRPRVRRLLYLVLIYLADVVDNRRRGAPGAVF